MSFCDGCADAGGAVGSSSAEVSEARRLWLGSSLPESRLRLLRSSGMMSKVCLKRGTEARRGAGGGPVGSLSSLSSLGSLSTNAPSNISAIKRLVLPLSSARGIELRLLLLLLVGDLKFLS